MGDRKQNYSNAAANYVGGALGGDSEDRLAYDRSKERERRHGEDWDRRKVSINEVVELFAPESKGRRVGQKFVYEGVRYNIVCDMAAGYLRIWDKERSCYVDLSGRPDKRGRAHYRIKRREEM